MDAGDDGLHRRERRVDNLSCLHVGHASPLPRRDRVDRVPSNEGTLTTRQQTMASRSPTLGGRYAASPKEAEELVQRICGRPTARRARGDGDRDANRAPFFLLKSVQERKISEGKGERRENESDVPASADRFEARLLLRRAGGVEDLGELAIKIPDALFSPIWH